MEDRYNLLTRLLVGVLKHQVKRYLGEDVVAALLEASSEHIGERLLDILKEGQSSSELGRRIAAALKSATEELEREQVYLRLNDAPEERVERVIAALANLESGDLLGRELQFAIQDLVSAIGGSDADNRRRISMQLYQVLLMTVVTIPELQPRAQDLLQQSRTWLLSEQIRRIEFKTAKRERVEYDEINASAEPRPERAFSSHLGDEDLRVGLLVADGTIELTGILGKGGQAFVWRGKLLTTGESVAVKFLHDDFFRGPESVQLFRKEVDALTELTGDAIVRLVKPLMYEYGRYFYAVEFVKGDSLEIIIQDSRVPIVTKIKTIIDVAEVLHTFHLEGFIHGDVKPQNIIVDSHNTVRLIDFGAMRKIGKHDVHEPVMFTPQYAAPEILALPHRLDESSETNETIPRGVRVISRDEVRPAFDIYSLGIVLFHALDPGLAQTAWRSDVSAFVDRLLVSSDIKAVLRKAIAAQPLDRFKSALEFKLELEAAVIAANAE